MERNGRASHNNEKKPLENSAPSANVPKKPSENNSSTSIFVNHGKSCLFLLSAKTLSYQKIILSRKEVPES